MIILTAAISTIEPSCLKNGIFGNSLGDRGCSFPVGVAVQAELNDGTLSMSDSAISQRLSDVRH
jgi:hypothetical protein